jgi:hypothetical protein
MRSHQAYGVAASKKGTQEDTMRKLLICVTALFLWVSLAGQSEKGKSKGKGESHAAHSSDASAVKDAIKKMEDELRQGSLKGDPSAAEKYLADDYRAISATSGQAFDKKQSIDRMKSGATKVSQINVSNDDVLTYGNDLAISHGIADVKVTVDGRDASGKYLFARTWAKRNGKWQAVWFQTTKMQ